MRNKKNNFPFNTFNRRPESVNNLTLTKSGLCSVTAELYLSSIGGKPTARRQFKNPGLLLYISDLVHHGTNSVYLSTSATMSYMCSIEYLKLSTEFHLTLCIQEPDEILHYVAFHQDLQLCGLSSGSTLFVKIKNDLQTKEYFFF